MHLIWRRKSTLLRTDSPIISVLADVYYKGYNMSLLGHWVSKLSVFAVVLSLSIYPCAQAEDYPNRPIRLVVSYAAGNITDILARIIAQKLSERWKQPVIVENRPGLGGSLGAQFVSKAPSDGYTLVFAAMASFAINPHLYAAVGYDPNADFSPIIGVAYPNGVLYANNQLKADNLLELIRYSKENLGQLNYGSAGNGTVPHLNMETLKAQTGMVATHIPYKAAGAVVTDVIGGSIQLAEESLGVVLPQLLAGKIKPIVAFSKRRLSQLPDLPAITEIFPNLEPITPWLGILGPAGMPPERVEMIHDAVSAILNQPDVIYKLNASAMEVLNSDPAQFKAQIKADYNRLGKLVKNLNLKVD